ncbi:MAG TPA: hypothetical protein VGR14_10590 [Verrucomicrobiae bacterium]|nr:hypothetical protein [Verrucomicrobiae bacterium]
MKTTPSRQRNAQAGGVLIVCLCWATVIGIALTSVMVMAELENGTVARSQAWNTSMVVAEAGLEDALALLNKNVGSSTPWTNNLTGDGWTNFGGVISTTRYLGTNSYNRSNYYTVYITNSTSPSNILSIGTVWYPDPWHGTTQISRAVQVKTSSSGVSTYGILVKNGVTLNGGISVQSFNSQTASNGVFTTNLNTGVVTIASTESNVVGEISGSGNVTVYGTVNTSPNAIGTGDITTSGNVSIGDTNWVNGKTNGIQPGHALDSLNLSIPPAPTPPVAYGYNNPVPPSGGSYGGTNYTYILNSGTYEVSSSVSMSGKQSMLINGNVTLNITGGLSMSGQSYIYITPGSTLTNYVGGAISISGQGVANGGGYATNCTLIGYGTNQTLAYSGNSEFVGTINAPSYAVTLSGGGSTPVNFVGALVSQSLTISGGYFFVYDQSLGGALPGLLTVGSWQEVVP